MDTTSLPASDFSPRSSHKMRWRRLFLVLLAVLICSTAVFVWRLRGRVRATDALNPLFWVRRARGEGLYDEKTRVLLHGNYRLREVAITIDDGPHPESCEALLDTFREYDAKATFFVVGTQMKQHPELIRRMVAEGHEVGNHTQNHPRLDTLAADRIGKELDWCNTNYQKITGQHMNLMRPPGVRYNETVLKVTAQRGYALISWNCGAHDYETVTADYITSRITNLVENGSIILLHDVPATAEAMPRLLTALKKEGYRFVTVSEMLAHLPKPLVLPTREMPLTASVDEKHP